MEDSGQLHAPAASWPGKGGYVGLRTFLDLVTKKKYLPVRGTEPRSSSPHLYYSHNV
jgi:hypothetical protein